MIHEQNTTEWQIGDIVIHDCDSKDKKMLMVVIGDKIENGVKLLKTSYLDIFSKKTITKEGNVWLNEIKYLHDPARFLISVTPEDIIKAREMIEVTKTKKKVARPNESQCEGCPNWDDVNGCWNNVKDVDSCPEIGEDGYYPIGENDDDEPDGWEEDI